MKIAQSFINFFVFATFVVVTILASLSIIHACEKSAYGEINKTAKNGIIAGKGWCLHESSKCSKSIPKRLARRMDEYGEWFEQYAGGLIPAHIAMTSITEAPEGPAQCSPDKQLKECGLLGIKYTQARDCNINVCDPEASIWCAARGGNARRIAMLKKYPQLKLAPPKDQYLIAGMAGGIGNLAITLIKKSGALDTIGSNGTEKLKYDSPYNRLLTWFGNSKKSQDENNTLYGRLTAYKVGFRISRGQAVMQHLMDYYGVDSFDDLPYGEFKIIPRSDHFAEYPGNSKHGKCEKYFKQMLKHKP